MAAFSVALVNKKQYKLLPFIGKELHIIDEIIEFTARIP